mgnify:CR=1 FL=1
MDKEPTIIDVLGAINTFSTKVDERLNTIEGDITSIKATLTTMPTRDDMNEALANTKADIILTMRKEDAKLHALVEMLREKKVLTEPDVRKILSLEPFPQLFV